MTQWLKDALAYLAAAASIFFGAILLWSPPAALSADPGAVGIALSFITGGFGALGVAITAAKVGRQLQHEFERGVRQGRLLFSTAGGQGPGHPDCGHGHIHLETKNNVDVQAAALAVRAWGNANLDTSKQELFESVNAMEDPLPPASGAKRPKGSLVIVEVLLQQTGRHSEAAHQRISDLATGIENDPSCSQFFQPNKVRHWCCWSDH